MSTRIGSAPSFQTVLRDVAHRVTGSRTMVASANGGVRQGSSAPAMIVRGNSETKRNYRQTFAQYSGSGNITTAPGFYSPFTTPSSFQIPTNRKEQYLWDRWWEENEPLVGAAIEFYADFPLSGFKLECANETITDFYEEMLKRLNFARLLPMISHSYHLYGDVFPYASLDCPKCHGACENPDTGEPCDHAGAEWKSVTLMNPDLLEVSPTMLDQEPAYYFLPDEMTKKIVQEGKPPHIYNAIPQEVKDAVRQNKPIHLAPECVYHFKRMAQPWQPYGTSIIRRLFTVLAYKDKLRQANWIIAERHILPIRIVKLGSEERPASPEELEDFQADFAAAANDPLITLVSHQNIDVDYVGASGKILQVTQEMEAIENELLMGLMMNKAMINGEGPTFAGAQVGLLILAKRLDRFRNEVKFWIEEKLFRPIAEWNGFTQPGKHGEDKLIYPTIKWDDLELRDQTNRLQMLMQLHQAGQLSTQTALELMEVDYDQEVERLRMERSGDFVSNPNLAMGGGMGSGYGGDGAAGGMPPGGAPGMPPGMPPEGGGVPPLAAGAPGGAPPPLAPMAEIDPAENYIRVASIIDALYQRHATENNHRLARFASVGFKSSAHKKFLESLAPPTGRGVLGPLPLDGFSEVSDFEGAPHKGGYDSVALNAYAIIERRADVAAGFRFNESERQISNLNPMIEAQMKFYLLSQSENEKADLTRVSAAPKQPLQRNNFTSLEQNLYRIVLQSNIPLPFYAQYSAGPNQEYQLDGAFPSVKLALEADSEEYHGDDEAIRKDRHRDMQLARQGWTVLRFKQDELAKQPLEVRNVIISAIKKLMGQ